jgi:hypothetical protein
MTKFSNAPAKWNVLSCVALLAAAGFWSLRPGPARSSATPAAPRAEPEVHYVTPRQLAESAAVATISVPAFSATAHTNEPFTWPRPGDARPLLLIFIKEGCPCSIEMEPYFHRLARTYADAACFAGLIDADVQSARRYAETNTSPYPILADPEKQIIRRLGAKNGVYVALLVQPDAALESLGAAVQNVSTIDSLWPGCSAELFTEMDRRIAAAAGVAERPLDVCGLPSALVTGCPF